jgi:hypothetical protein
MPAAGSCGGVAVAAMAMKHTPAEEVAEWVEESTSRQGVPVKVDDPGVIEGVVMLLREGRVPVRAARPVKAGRGRSGCGP